MSTLAALAIIIAGFLYGFVGAAFARVLRRKHDLGSTASALAGAFWLPLSILAGVLAPIITEEDTSTPDLSRKDLQ